MSINPSRLMAEVNKDHPQIKALRLLEAGIKTQEQYNDLFDCIDLCARSYFEIHGDQYPGELLFYKQIKKINWDFGELFTDAVERAAMRADINSELEVLDYEVGF